MVKPTIKPNEVAKATKRRRKADLQEALLNKANYIVKKHGLVLDLSAEAYERKDGSKSESFYTVTAKTEEGEVAWTSVQLLTTDKKGASLLVKPRRK